MLAAVHEGIQGVHYGDGGPFGALVVKNGEIIARGHNMVSVAASDSKKPYPQVLRWNDPTAHAEVVAIRAASKALGTFELTGCELYTSCYPCAHSFAFFLLL